MKKIKYRRLAAGDRVVFPHNVNGFARKGDKATVKRVDNAPPRKYWFEFDDPKRTSGWHVRANARRIKSYPRLGKREKLDLESLPPGTKLTIVRRPRRDSFGFCPPGAHGWLRPGGTAVLAESGTKGFVILDGGPGVTPRQVRFKTKAANSFLAVAGQPRVGDTRPVDTLAVKLAKKFAKQNSAAVSAVPRFGAKKALGMGWIHDSRDDTLIAMTPYIGWLDDIVKALNEADFLPRI